MKTKRKRIKKTVERITVMKFKKCLINVILNLIFLNAVQTALSDYINGIRNYFGYSRGYDIDQNTNGEYYTHKIPYEVSVNDDKFLAQAAQLTGVALSELDSCQQRVVLKLKSDCDKMNDEQLAKMAVHLLNCQSFVEGRQIYPCTDEMSIKDCTTNMDSDTWTSYHLMSNRARAVCYTIRQSQFRGLAELTVNRLMDAAHNQLNTLGRIVKHQEDLKDLAEITYDKLNQGYESLSRQQNDIQRAQFHGQLAIEDNIRRLIEEKRLILETHNQLIEMTRNMQNKLGDSLQQLDYQNHESKINHKELIEDLLVIHEKTQDIFKKIDESSDMLLQQNVDFRKQYESTLQNLQEVNKTVHNLVALVGGTRRALEERLAWITTALGGTDLAIDRMYVLLWHSAFMLLAMLTCAFLSVRTSTRFVVATLPPLNLAVALKGENHLEPLSLATAILIFILGQMLISGLLVHSPSAKQTILWIKGTTVPAKIKVSHSISKESATSTNYQEAVPLSHELNYNRSTNFTDEEMVDFSEKTDIFRNNFTSLTPPVSRNGHYSARSGTRSRSTTPLYINNSLRGSCHAKTRLGTPCKLLSLPGRDYCHRHQTGDSVFG